MPGSIDRRRLSFDWVIGEAENLGYGRGMRQRTRSWATALLCIAVLTLVSFLPSKGKHALHTKGRLHGPGHLMIFLLTTVVLLRLAKRRSTRVLVLVGLGLLGPAVEYVQSVRDGYGVEWHDVFVDILGVTLGALALALLGGLRERAGTPQATGLPQ